MHAIVLKDECTKSGVLGAEWGWRAKATMNIQYGQISKKLCHIKEVRGREEVRGKLLFQCNNFLKKV